MATRMVRISYDHGGYKKLSVMHCLFYISRRMMML